ncbi:uncharacterized protein si:ch211-245h14.1 [Colossoma macropomum]|uniref:uncharacterized protein si:ch211-245h14.1 n=1 Tax=Colossoma macropomum TaxID=42526 RepID=UPI00186521BE|nr:uncharacterized protein si:ch211-245h14.1 [Colossoma macropomum]
MWNNSSKRKELRERIERLSGSVEPALRGAGVDDKELLTLTREDLNELFPGIENFQLRRKIMQMVSEAAQEPLQPNATTLVGALRDLIERNDRSGPAVDSMVREYLCALRDLEKHLTAALDFLKPHIELLENLSHVPAQREATGSAKTLSLRHSASENLTHPTSYSVPPQPVKIHSLVCGNTLDAHRSILRLVQPVKESSLEDCSVILVFCPIATRAGTDVEAAIQKIQGPKAAILVVMHHTQDQEHTGVNPRTLSAKPNIVECVNVLFHDSVPGLLLSCNANKQAIAQIQAALQQYK